MANGEIQISGLPQAALPLSGSDLLHLKQGITDVKCTWDELLDPHAGRTDNPHGVTAKQVGLDKLTNDAQLKIASNLTDLTDVAVARNKLNVYSKQESDAKLKVHTDQTNNPHKVTAAQVGLDKVPNKAPSDAFRTVTDTMATTKAVNDLFKAIQGQTPPGTILPTMSSVNPSTYMLCGGVWELIGHGRALVGFNGTDPAVAATDGRAAGSTFGAQSRQITASNLPAHKHNVTLTGGGHTHPVNGTAASSGGHAHKVEGNTNDFNYGQKGVQVDGVGDHVHNAWTGRSGNHQHRLPTDSLWNGAGNMQTLSSTDKNDEGYRDMTDWAGDHDHAVGIGGAGGHSHAARVDIGGHTHWFSTWATTDGVHGHTVTGTASSTTHTHSGVTEDNATTNTAFNIEQPSLVVYLWQRKS